MRIPPPPAPCRRRPWTGMAIDDVRFNGKPICSEQSGRCWYSRPGPTWGRAVDHTLRRVRPPSGNDIIAAHATGLSAGQK